MWRTDARLTAQAQSLRYFARSSHRRALHSNVEPANLTAVVEHALQRCDEVDALFMGEALEIARLAAQYGDVPVGAIVVQDGKIVGTGGNRREMDADPTGHAEIVALREACRVAKRWRVDGATLYVTLEPCPMCAGAIVNARVARLVYGADDHKAGAVKSLYGICDDVRLNHRVEIVGGVRAQESADLLRRFFAQARRRARQTGEHR